MAIEIGKSKFSMEDRIEFFRSFGSWLTSGSGSMPVHEALKNTCDSFSRDEYAGFRARMGKVYEDFHSGSTTVTEGLRRADLGFSNQELAILNASEKSNQLRMAVPALVEAMEMRANSSKMLIRKLSMPLIGGFMLILMSLGVLIFMMPTVVEPVLQRDPDKINGFPAIIKYYWYLSVWLRANPYIPIAFAAAPVVIFLTRNTPLVKPYIEATLMKIKPTRRMILSFNGVMLVYFMPALVRSGMPMPDVLNAMSDSLENSQLKSILKQAATDHEQGYRLGDVLERLPIKGAFRSAVEAGEKTGKIAERVEDLKSPFVNEFDRIVRRGVAALMLMVMGILLPMFIISMYTTLVTPMIALMEY